MSAFLQAYSALSASSPRSQVSSVLQSVTDAFPSQIDPATRKQLVQTILDDLTRCSSQNGKKTTLTSKEALPALLAVKTLGKDPAGSEVISSASNLSSLIALSHTYKDNLDASNEALRCVANALLLITEARITFIEKEVGGGEVCVALLEKSTLPERIFLASRILFLCTVSMGSSGDYIKGLVEARPPGHSGNIIEVIGMRLDGLTRNILSSAKLAREAMTDLLKFTFNILLHYPKIVDESEGDPDSKVMGECWSDRLDNILPPLIRTFVTLPSSSPVPLDAPMSHVIHALITIPVTPTLRPKWFPTGSSRGSPRPSTSKRSPDSPTGSPDISGKGQLPLSASSSSSNSPTFGPTKDGKHGAFDRAISALTAGRRFSRSRSPHPGSRSDVLQRAYDLLDSALAHFLPGTVDPDDASVRVRCKDEAGASLDDVMLPLVLLLTKLCAADEAARARMRERILPDDLDRTSPLEGRPDLLGRCLRLLACAYHTRLKPAVGEMLYAVCDSDAGTLASYVGYGNAAGFLFHKGVTAAPPRPTTSNVPVATTSGMPINPITGVAEVPREAPEMSNEEKEREAEKLFVLFDRLEKSGAIPPSQNPIRKAAQDGKLG
ncbi:predicted protein [Sparassis crispa]|uniref:Synembryn-A n=1 Tax=Sparassis crispa TaxID=139825 RepID=A0A401G9W6_9APHY|nr:predicted protein [Sparassis crispa]GBE78960.1 predicted protein [Sparassis crispa]